MSIAHRSENEAEQQAAILTTARLAKDRLFTSQRDRGCKEQVLKEFCVCVCACVREMQIKHISSSYLILHNFQCSTAHLKCVTSKTLLN